MGRFSNLMIYLKPAISRPIDPRTDAIVAARSEAGIIEPCRNAHKKD